MLSSFVVPDFKPLAWDADCHDRILIFDSGVGGLSVYKHIKSQLPEAGVLYVADTAAFPYGEWDADALTRHIVQLICNITSSWHPSAVVIACNTASTLVLPPLRAALHVPVIGTVPAIKPAAEYSHSKMFSVLATPGTVQRDYTRDLIAKFAPDHQVKLVGAAGLAALAEAKLAKQQVNLGLLATEIRPCFVESGDQRTDCVVLGCTHYPFLLREISRVAPWPVEWIDPSPAIAKRVACMVRDIRLAERCKDLFFSTAPS